MPLAFIEHSKRAEVLQDLGITVQNITRSLVTWSSSDLNVKEEMQLPQDESVNRKTASLIPSRSK